MGIALFQMAVFIDTTEAKSRDSDGDGTPDVGKLSRFFTTYSAVPNKSTCTLIYFTQKSLPVCTY